MADLSAVLRKTIDGLPKATPQLRAKVYEKARAAIARQIKSANPPLADDVVEARRSAIEDAIDRTEDHYLDLDKAAVGSSVDLQPASGPAAGGGRAAPPASPPLPLPPVVPAASVLPAAPVLPAPVLPKVAAGPVAGEKPAWMRAPAKSPSEPVADAGKTPAVAAANRVDPAIGGGGLPPAVSAGETRGPVSGSDRAGKPADAARKDPASSPPWMKDGPAPAEGFDPPAIPAADLAAPRYANGRRKDEAKRGRAPLFASVAVLLLAIGGGLAFFYQDEVQAFLGSDTTTVAATTPGATTQAPTTAVAPSPDVTTTQPPAATTPAPGAATPESSVPATTAPPAATEPSSNRRFTQRLLPDGTEVDEGPGAGNANAFEEGTNIAAASPETLTPPDAAPAEAIPATPPAATPPAAQPPTETAAVQPDTVAGVPAVAQKAIFYEERSETEQGTQRGGNVVWSVVNESPSEGQPAEPAIRAVADVPESNVRLTMTIRRNADATLPASHVIELMFDVPPGFAGGQIANVQRLALKPTEEARGEPLIGVAGKISDGFFIIALNNLAQATQTNLQLLGSEQWIDIPLAYATGRRALISIEKGIPGDRVFKEAMDAWAAKT